MLSKLVMIPFLVQLLCERAAFLLLGIDLKREEVEEQEQGEEEEEEDEAEGSIAPRNCCSTTPRGARLQQKNGSGQQHAQQPF